MIRCGLKHEIGRILFFIGLGNAKMVLALLSRPCGFSIYRLPLGLFKRVFQFLDSHEKMMLSVCKLAVFLIIAQNLILL